MISQSSGYAMTALGFVAAAGGRPVLVKEVAQASGIPAAYLAKLVHILAKRGLVVTQRGVGGGVTLARQATLISLLDICQALADPILETRCMLSNVPCSDVRACPAHEFWTAQREQVMAFLKRTTVADIAAFEARKRWKQEPETGGVMPAIRSVHS
ncbi:MAG: Rrf2 family transcriptional regulator [Phycisphaeraceae bacterium]|nr:Rrf2 family transcriptional regulator [Phycisphaeraceae bacterium]